MGHQNALTFSHWKGGREGQWMLLGPHVCTSPLCSPASHSSCPPSVPSQQRQGIPSTQEPSQALTVVSKHQPRCLPRGKAGARGSIPLTCLQGPAGLSSSLLCGCLTATALYSCFPSLSPFPSPTSSACTPQISYSTQALV